MIALSNVYIDFSEIGEFLNTPAFAYILTSLVNSFSGTERALEHSCFIRNNPTTATAQATAFPGFNSFICIII